MPQPPDGQHIAKSSLDVMLLEKNIVYKVPLGGAKPLVAHGLIYVHLQTMTETHVKFQRSQSKL